MSLKIPVDGLTLESSAKSALPLQAFAISLSDSDIEGMIECIHSGQGIQLSLGISPSFLVGNGEVRIQDSEPCEYDLFYSNSAYPTQLSRLPNPTMSIFNQPKMRLRLAKPEATVKAEKEKEQEREKTKASAEKPSERPTTKPNSSTPQHAGGKQDDDDATAILKNAMAKAEHDKLENSTRIVDGMVTTKNGKMRSTGNTTTRLLGSRPSSPALSGLTSPSMLPTSSGGSQSQDRAKQQRFPLVHELAVQELTFYELQSKCSELEEADFKSALTKVADFDDSLQKYVLKKLYWSELDPFDYNFATKEERQKAIDNAVKQYDRRRLSPSDPVWQKLLPVAERGKGKCISNLQSKISAAAAAPKMSVQKADGTSASGDSEKDDLGSAGSKKATGGEPMSRSNSQTKKAKNGTDAEMKRILSGGGKKATPKPSPKVSPTKPIGKTANPKGGHFLSKEYVSETSDDDEVPLAKSKTTAAAATQKSLEKPKSAGMAATEKPREFSAPKSRPQAKPGMPKERIEGSDRGKEKSKSDRNSIEARPLKSASTTAKRAREDDDDSSSSGTPLSKRLKPKDAQQPASKQPGAAREKQAAAHRRQTSTSSVGLKQPRALSDGSKVSSTLATGAKSKGTNSPTKSSPLASSPPTTAADLEQERFALVRQREKQREREREREREQRERERQRERIRERERERERERDRETIVSSSSSNGGNSSVSSRGSCAGLMEPATIIAGKKRKAGALATMNGGGNGGSSASSSDDDDNKRLSSASKRPKLSAEVLSKANQFKHFYTRYEALHREIVALEDPPREKMADLLDMRDRLAKMKTEIYREVSVGR